MLGGFRLYDADAHVMMSPRLWADLPAAYRSRRPLPVRIADAPVAGPGGTAWLIEGRTEPHVYGPGAQGANTPASTMEEFGAPVSGRGSWDLSDPHARLRDLDGGGIDVQMLFPSSLYACISSDPGCEAAMFRAYNRYVGRQCAAEPRRLKWAGLLPLREPREGVAAVQELVEYGATAAVVFGTAGERMLSHESLAPVWEAFARCGLPLCVHMGRSYPPFDHLLDTRPAVHTLAMGLPAQLAFVAIVAQGMLDRYPTLKVAFLEFGAEWLFYVVGRLGHYWPSYQRDPIARDEGKLALSPIADYVKSGRLFVAPEAQDSMLPAEMELIGEGQILFASDYPHGEGRDDAASEFLERADLSDAQKRLILYDNAVRFYGEP